MERLKRRLEELFHEVRGCRFLVLIDTIDRKVVLDMWKDAVESRDKVKENLLHIFNYTVLERQKNARNPFIRKALQDFKSLTFEMERGYVLFTALPDSRYVLASGILRETGLGFWRAAIKRALESFENAGD